MSGRVLSSQTIGVEFASKIVRVGSGARRKRIKLQVRQCSLRIMDNEAITDGDRCSCGILLVPNVSVPYHAPIIVELLERYWSTT